MSDSTAERNERLKATMRQKETPLNTSPARRFLALQTKAVLASAALWVTLILGPARKVNWALLD
jgi:hypothetical protein